MRRKYKCGDRTLLKISNKIRKENKKNVEGEKDEEGNTANAANEEMENEDCSAPEESYDEEQQIKKTSLPEDADVDEDSILPDFSCYHPPKQSVSSSNSAEPSQISVLQQLTNFHPYNRLQTAYQPSGYEPSSYQPSGYQPSGSQSVACDQSFAGTFTNLYPIPSSEVSMFSPGRPVQSSAKHYDISFDTKIPKLSSEIHSFENVIRTSNQVLLE
jgi:hypothetical protein